MASIPTPSVEAAFALHQAGRLREAVAIYGQLLKRDPRRPDVLHLFAVAMHQQGDSRAAEPLLRMAISLNPRVAAYHNNFGMVLRALGRPDEATASFRAALRLDAAYADALVNLSDMLPRAVHAAEVRQALRRACVLEPAHDQGLANLGVVERFAGELGRAIAAQRRAFVVRPALAARLINLGSVLVEAERYDEAERHLRRGVLLDPGLAEVWNDLGYLFLVRLQVDPAEAAFRRAVGIRPGYGSAWAGRAEIAFVTGDPAAAVRHSLRAVEADPGNPQLRFRCGIHRLAVGDMAGGWADHDALWRKSSAVQRLGGPPRWSGEPLAGRTLLIGADQGVGDELLYSSCAPDAVRAAGRVILECDRRLVGLFRRSFPQALVHAYDRDGGRSRPVHRYGWIPPDWTPDLAIEGGGLMRWFRPSVASLDAAGGAWLTVDPDRAAAMRRYLVGLGRGLKIGISWRSMRVSEMRNVHYPGLAALAPILRVPGVRFVCLQYGSDWRQELQEAAGPVAVVPDLDTTADLDGVAALVSQLDAVICPSSTLGWVGAGVGAPVWLLYITPVFLEFGTERLPGFPTIRPYRKTQLQPWEPLVERAAADLRAWAAESV